jgi:hypothetical protein
MEKVLYLLWRDAGASGEFSEAGERFGQRLRGDLAERLLALGARGVQVNVADAAAAPGETLRQSNTQPQIEGMLSLWLDSAVARFRQPFDDAIAAAVPRMAAYLVTESQPIRNTRHPPQPGSRTAGFAQVAVLRRPPRLTYEAWLDIWHNSHTQVAIDTQSTFQYVQNVIIRPLSYGAPLYDAVVEECFPAEAMTDPQVFFDGVGDPEKFQRNLQGMMESVQRFIDLDKIDVLPTSQYVIKAPF